MAFEPRLDILGAAMADQSRVLILCELMDGRAHTGKELACAAGIAPNTASDHLARLQQARMIVAQRSGRFVYYRIADAEVAEVLERMSALSPTDHLYRARGKDSAPELIARTCYNHIAGRLGVLLTSHMCAMGWLSKGAETLALSNRGRAELTRLGVLDSGKQNLACKACLDWSERRTHLSGPVGTALFDRALAQGWVRRQPTGRALDITAKGYDVLHQKFDITEDAVLSRTYPTQTSALTEPI